jgi:hypothetical protein
MDNGQFGGNKRQERPWTAGGMVFQLVVLIFKFRWISLTGLFVVFDWMKINFIPSASLHLWIYSFV